MNTRRVNVQDEQGKEIPAELILCPECGGDTFKLFVVLSTKIDWDKPHHHNHLQCENCSRSFCQGGKDCGATPS